MDSVRLRGLSLDCIVGILPDEREREQKLELDITLGADLRRAGRTGRISATCDYSRVAREVQALVCFRRYYLIEAAAEEVAAMLLGVHDNARVVRVSIDKPGAVRGLARSGAVSIRRTRKDFPVRSEATSYGAVELLLETLDARLERVRVSPGERLEEAPRAGEALCWLVAGKLEQGGRALERGCPRAYSAEPLLNTGSKPATLFRCWR